MLKNNNQMANKMPIQQGILKMDSEMDSFVAEAIKAANEYKKGGLEATKTQKANYEQSSKAIERFDGRIIESNGIEEYEAISIANMYQDLAPDDKDGKISVKMMKRFINETVEKAYPEEFSTKVKPYYDLKNPMPEAKKRKSSNYIKTFWKRFRTVENAYNYSKEFRSMAERIAPKLDAPKTMSVVERCKWLRLWAFVFMYQSGYWYDFETVDKYFKMSKEYDMTLELTPEVLVKYEEIFFGEIEEGSLMLQMLETLVSMYPENVQKDVMRFAEFDKNEPDFLNAGYVRMHLKKELFPVMWVSPALGKCTKQGIRTTKEYLVESIIKAYRKGVKNLDTFFQTGIDPYRNFVLHDFKMYKLGTVIEDGREKTIAVSCEIELLMEIEVYKYLRDSKMPFGDEMRTLEEYGYAHLLDDPEEESEELVNEMEQQPTESLSSDENDVLSEPEESYDNILDDPEEEQKELFDKIKTDLADSPEEAKKMTAALKRIKVFGEKTASESDLNYLKFFKYMLKQESRFLPKNMINVYGKVFG